MAIKQLQLIFEAELRDNLVLVVLFTASLPFLQSFTFWKQSV